MKSSAAAISDGAFQAAIPEIKSHSDVQHMLTTLGFREKNGGQIKTAKFAKDAESTICSAFFPNSAVLFVRNTFS